MCSPSDQPGSLLYTVDPESRRSGTPTEKKISVGKCAVCSSTYRGCKLLSCAVIALDFYPRVARLPPSLLPPISHIKDAIDVIKSASRNMKVQFLLHRCIRQPPHPPQQTHARTRTHTLQWKFSSKLSFVKAKNGRAHCEVVVFFSTTTIHFFSSPTTVARVSSVIASPLIPIKFCVFFKLLLLLNGETIIFTV